MLREGVLVVGAGGGGDIVSAHFLCALLGNLVGTKKCVPLAILWERWVVDPYPGPLPRSLLRRVEVGDYCVKVSGESYAVRGGRFKLVPQASSIASIRGENVLGATLEQGTEGLRRCVEEALDEFGLAGVVALDVGGDILATGYEESLWSPLADSMTLAAVSYFPSIVAVSSPGADGELSQEYVLKVISELISSGHYVGVLGFWEHHAQLLEEALKVAITEASRVPLLALKGKLGRKPIRSGTRYVDINLNSLLTFFLKTEGVLNRNVLAKAYINTKSLAEALKIASDLGIVTELHLEIEIARRYGCGPNTKARVDWASVRESLKRKLAKGTPLSRDD